MAFPLFPLFLRCDAWNAAIMDTTLDHEDEGYPTGMAGGAGWNLKLGEVWGAELQTTLGFYFRDE